MGSCTSGITAQPFVHLQRDQIPSETECPICTLSVKDDEGRSWVAHKDVANRDEGKINNLIHLVHTDCARATYETQAQGQRLRGLNRNFECIYHDVVIDRSSLGSTEPHQLPLNEEAIGEVGDGLIIIEGDQDNVELFGRNIAQRMQRMNQDYDAAMRMLNQRNDEIRNEAGNNAALQRQIQENNNDNVPILGRFLEFVTRQVARMFGEIRE